MNRLLKPLFCALLVLAAAASPAYAGGRDVRATLLKDIWPGRESSHPTRLAAQGNRVFFAASSPRTGHELWRTNGRRRGTKLVADIVPGEQSSVPRGLAATDEFVFFTVRSDGGTTRRLWQSDGTAAGTGPVPGTDGLAASNPRASGRLALFTVATPAGGEIWATDGRTPAARIGAGVLPQPAQALGTTLLPLADDEHGTELWRTDGTPAGTSLVKDVIPGPESSNPTGITAFGDRALFFVSAGFGSELWSTDGTEAGTTKVTTFDERFQVFGDATVPLGEGLLFTLDNQELWRTDGTAPGTASTGVMTSGNLVRLLSRVGRKVYLAIRTRLWRTDGTGAGTVAVARRLFEPSPPLRLGRTAVFAAGSRELSRELWQTDGTRRGTRLVRDILPGSGGSRIESLTPVGDRIVFSAYDGRRRHGQELWVARIKR